MNQKELDIQRALGTLDTYYINIEFPRREEPPGLDQLMAEVMPVFTRFYDGSSSIFVVEATQLCIAAFIEALTILLKDTKHNRGYRTRVHVYEPSKYDGDSTTTISHNYIK